MTDKYMNGIFSSAPTPQSVRLIIGSNGLLQQAAITWCLPNAANQARLLIVATSVPAIIAFLFAVRGVAHREIPRPWGHHRGR